MISLFADSGMRLSELASIKADNIDWQNYTITIWGKGNKQRKAPFTKRTTNLLRQVIPKNSTGSNTWHIGPHGIQLMLQIPSLQSPLSEPRYYSHLIFLE